MRSTATDWSRLVGEFQRGGMTQREFCERRGVAVHSLRYWLYKLRGQQTASASRSIELVPVRVGGSSEAQHFEAQVGNVALRFEAGIEPSYVAAVLRELAPSC